VLSQRADLLQSRSPESCARVDVGRALPARLPRARRARNAPIFEPSQRFRGARPGRALVSKMLVPAPATEAVVIGASAGAVEALSVLLPTLCRDLRVPIVIVVHLPPRRPSLLPELFRARCAAPVSEPVDKQPVGAGTVWFAPADYHLAIELE